jgi:hypothetical protein
VAGLAGAIALPAVTTRIDFHLVPVREGAFFVPQQLVDRVEEGGDSRKVCALRAGCREIVGRSPDDNV